MKRMKKILLFLLAICLLATFSGVVRAEGERPRKALLIGNDDYENPKVNDLKGAIKDTEKMELMLLEQKQPYDIHKVHNLRKEEMIRAIRTTFANSQEGDLNFFFYAGHGLYDEEKKSSAIVGTDDGKIYADELEAIFKDLPGTFLLVFDACNSGGLIDDKAFEVPLGDNEIIWTTVDEELPTWEMTEEEMLEEEMTDVEENPSDALFGEGLIEPFSYQERGFIGSKYYVVAAAHKFEQSIEISHPNWGWGGLFTRAYVRANGYRGVFLADKNKDNRVTFDELVTHVKAAVRRSTVTYYPQFSDLEVGAAKLTQDPKGPVRHDVSCRKVWEIRFNQNVDLASAREKIKITDWSGKSFPITITPSHSQPILRLRSESEYDPISYYKLLIEKGLTSQNGNHALKKDVVLHFFTNEENRREQSLQLVLNGKLDGYPKKTVGQAFQHEIFKTPTFKYRYDNETKEDLVIFTGRIKKNNKPVLLKAVFTVDLNEKNFALTFIGVGKTPLTEEEKKELFDIIYQ